MKKLKLILLGVMVFLCINETSAQRVVISKENTPVDTVEVGDVVVFAHQKKPNRRVHYFQGRVTGINTKTQKVKVFDYARSTRVMSIVGKKIKVNTIVGVKKLDEKQFNKREQMAVAASVLSAVGTGIGGSAGTAMQLGAGAGAIGIDAVTREFVGVQHIKAEIRE